ncbi:Crp/Fnr family transcriptional regulator [Georhizobium profundi]|nr:helix-turn-helix domain-containing protein [Georhizobium profundi]
MIAVDFAQDRSPSKLYDDHGLGGRSDVVLTDEGVMSSHNPFTNVTALHRCTKVKCGFCSGLSPEARHELSKLARIRSYRAGQTIVAQAEEVHIIGTVLEGVVRANKTLRDGRHQIVGLLLPSDVFGRLDGATSRVSLEAASDANVCSFKRQPFESLMDRFPEIERRMLLAVSDQLDAAQDWMLLLATQSVLERVATFLLMFCARDAGDRGALDIPVSRRDMAAYLGTTVESVSRAMQAMKRAGILEGSHSRHIEVTDFRRLASLSQHEPEQLGIASRLPNIGQNLHTSR